MVPLIYRAGDNEIHASIRKWKTVCIVQNVTRFLDEYHVLPQEQFLIDAF